jgi:hypothetical protein
MSPEAIRLLCESEGMSDVIIDILVGMAESQENIIRRMGKHDNHAGLDHVTDEAKDREVERRLTLLERIAWSTVGTIVLGALAIVGKIAWWAWEVVWAIV